MEIARHESINALVMAILDELVKSQTNSMHSAIHISRKDKILSNGIEYSCVQIQCQASCGWLIEAIGEDANLLKNRVTLVQEMLRENERETPDRLSKIICAIFPEVVGATGSDSSKTGIF